MLVVLDFFSRLFASVVDGRCCGWRATRNPKVKIDIDDPGTLFIVAFYEQHSGKLENRCSPIREPCDLVRYIVNRELCENVANSVGFSRRKSKAPTFDTISLLCSLFSHQISSEPQALSGFWSPSVINRTFLFSPNHHCHLSRMPSTKNATFSASEAPVKNISTFSSEEDQEILEIKEATARYDGRVAIQKTADQRGWGLFALTTFHRGDLVMRGTAVEKSSVQTKHSVQLDWDWHVEMDLPSRFINHICNDANVGVRPNEFGAYNFYALHQIDKDQELLWDYETTEYQIEGFPCSCGSSTCRGELKGFKVHKEQVIETYGEDFIAPYLLDSKKQ
jgi:hypothetical protein